jgi:hypothetical protein
MGCADLLLSEIWQSPHVAGESRMRTLIFALAAIVPAFAID